MKYRKAVFIVVYAKAKKGIEYLILRRKLHWKGWEFPKGATNFLETKKNAVKRELKEETGLVPFEGKIKKFDFSGKYDYDKIIPGRHKIKGQTFSLYSVEVKKNKVKVDGYEHENYKWVSFKEAIKMLKWKNQKESIKMVENWLSC